MQDWFNIRKTITIIYHISITNKKIWFFSYMLTKPLTKFITFLIKTFKKIEINKYFLNLKNIYMP